MTSREAHAKINLALVVGDRGAHGLHEVATVLERVDLSDTIALAAADGFAVEGFAEDTIVRAALEALAAAAGVAPRWTVHVEKRIPVAAGLGGGSSDAATALELANAMLPEPLPRPQLRSLARSLGADVPFFLAAGPQLGTGDGATLEPVTLPRDYAVLLLLPHGETKESTGAVYGRYRGGAGFAERRQRLREVVKTATAARDLAALPRNDLAASPLARQLVAAGAFRADVTGAGPALYGLFDDEASAERAAAELVSLGRTWVAKPAC